MTRRLSILAVLVLVVAPASAQLLPGDWILANYGFTNPGLHKITPSTGLVQPIVPGGGYYPASVMMDLDNFNLLAASGATLDTVTPSGIVAQGAPTSNGFGGQTAPDQDGSLLCAEGYGLYRLDQNLQSEDWVWSGLYAFLKGVCIDGDTGDYIIVGEHGYFADGRVTRIHRTTGASTIIAAGLGPVQSIDFDPITGDFLVANGDPLAPILRVGRNGSVGAMGSFVVPSAAGAVRVAPETGNLLVVGPSAARLVTPLGATITNVPLVPPMDYPGGVEIYGSRKISGFGPATAGTDYFVRFSFPGCAGQNFLGAMSTAQRPGIPMNDGSGRVVSLRADWLFNATVGGIPGLLDGFSGVLDANGAATGVVHIPAGFPAGVRFFVSAVAVQPSAPSGIETANTWGFTTN